MAPDDGGGVGGGDLDRCSQPYLVIRGRHLRECHRVHRFKATHACAAEKLKTLQELGDPFSLADNEPLKAENEQQMTGHLSRATPFVFHFGFTTSVSIGEYVNLATY